VEVKIDRNNTHVCRLVITKTSAMRSMNGSRRAGVSTPMLVPEPECRSSITTCHSRRASETRTRIWWRATTRHGERPLAITSSYADSK